MLGCLLLSLFGWRFDGVLEDDDRPAVVLFVHTHISDFVWMWLATFSCLHECKAIVKETLWEHWLLGRFMRFGPFLPAPKKESTSPSGSVSKWAGMLKESQNLFLTISPKGTRDKSAWRTGWKHIAKEAEVKVRVIHMDWDKKVMFIGRPLHPDDDEQEIFKQYWDQIAFEPHCHENPSNPEEHKQDPINWELFCPFDACVVSMWLFLPHLFGLFLKGERLGFVISLTALLVSAFYHLNREILPNVLLVAEGYLASMCMIYTFFWAVVRSGFFVVVMDSGIYMPFFMGALTYAMIIPRHTQNVKTRFRGRYAIWHPFFHVCVALVANRLTQYL